MVIRKHNEHSSMGSILAPRRLSHQLPGQGAPLNSYLGGVLSWAYVRGFRVETPCSKWIHCNCNSLKMQEYMIKLTGNSTEIFFWLHNWVLYKLHGHFGGFRVQIPTKGIHSCNTSLKIHKNMHQNETHPPPNLKKTQTNSINREKFKIWEIWTKTREGKRRSPHPLLLVSD